MIGGVGSSLPLQPTIKRNDGSAISDADTSRRDEPQRRSVEQAPPAEEALQTRTQESIPFRRVNASNSPEQTQLQRKPEPDDVSLAAQQAIETYQSTANNAPRDGVDSLVSIDLFV
ncbi:hypothetical protein O5O45_17310 [Hahella aquimaris]|uniref:hypothetical protein n=1 Tax=Hahella sp. HNIBRBA332 TaxID=3015983 RepID=UPI00273BF580|nr:hypothetical protein [Hahella sp. HNIBRBA332]WLQ11498.1 hypothetical protein O5O45_17310 [Hahella sp. HNIBRBA332]